MAQKRNIRHLKHDNDVKGNDRTLTPFRIGIGYDIHRFSSGRPFMLGGVRIPYTAGLDGHSDADVVLHAICDAILGAAALGDIGKHFPNSSRKWKGVPSSRLLSHVVKLVKESGYVVRNVDATVILEAPKIQRYIPRMTKHIARVLSVPPSSVSVKATTNEGLDALGSGSGCAAFATALISIRMARR